MALGRVVVDVGHDGLDLAQAVGPASTVEAVHARVGRLLQVRARSQVLRRNLDAFPAPALILGQVDPHQGHPAGGAGRVTGEHVRDAVRIDPRGRGRDLRRVDGEPGELGPAVEPDAGQVFYGGVPSLGPAARLTHLSSRPNPLR